MKTSLQPDRLLSIYQQFPDLNFVWLLIGEESMLRTGNTNNPDTTNSYNTDMETKTNLIKVLYGEIDERDKRIIGLKLEIEELKKKYEGLGEMKDGLSPGESESRRNTG